MDSKHSQNIKIGSFFAVIQNIRGGAFFETVYIDINIDITNYDV